MANQLPHRYSYAIAPSVWTVSTKWGSLSVGVVFPSKPYFLIPFGAVRLLAYPVWVSYYGEDEWSIDHFAVLLGCIPSEVPSVFQDGIR